VVFDMFILLRLWSVMNKIINCLFVIASSFWKPTRTNWWFSLNFQHLILHNVRQTLILAFLVTRASIFLQYGKFFSQHSRLYLRTLANYTSFRKKLLRSLNKYWLSHLILGFIIILLLFLASFSIFWFRFSFPIRRFYIFHFLLYNLFILLQKLFYHYLFVNK
jgi:hypothetical protein